MNARHFYDDPYWRGKGRMLWNLRRMHALLIAVTEHEPDLQAPYFLPTIHQYKRTSWLGWEATWWTTDGAYLHVWLAMDRLTLEIGHMDEEGEMISAEVLRFSDDPPAGSNSVYEPYSQAGLDDLILRAQAWLHENRRGLQNMDYSLNRVFFNEPAATMWERQADEDWSDHIGSPALTAIRRLLCLMQAAHHPAAEPGFLTFMGYSENDHNLEKLHQISCEWFYTEGYDGPCAEIELHADGSLLWDGFSQRRDGKRELIFSLEHDTDDERTQVKELTLDVLHAAIIGQHAWLGFNETHREPRHRLYDLFGLMRDGEHLPWFNPRMGGLVNA